MHGCVCERVCVYVNVCACVLASACACVRACASVRSALVTFLHACEDMCVFHVFVYVCAFVNCVRNM